MPYAGVNGQRLYYEVGGEGDLVVLLHGFLANADLMEAPATGLASGFRAIRIDRRLCGRSEGTPVPVSLADEVADLTALLDWFGVEAAHFLAHDEGAEVAIELALTRPERALSMALLAPSLDGLDPWLTEFAAQPQLVAAIQANPKYGALEKWLASPVFDVAREREGMHERLTEMFRRSTAPVDRFIRPPRSGPSQAERLGEIRTRTAVFVGERDLPGRLETARTIVAGIAGAELVAFPELSRFLHVEESRAVMRRLTDFFLPEPEIER
jgi:pimeloyl-ACP methyl ester carboxylesterase